MYATAGTGEGSAGLPETAALVTVVGRALGTGAADLGASAGRCTTADALGGTQRSVRDAVCAAEARAGSCATTRGSLTGVVVGRLWWRGNGDGQPVELLGIRSAIPR
jgi:hypothetical protein